MESSEDQRLVVIICGSGTQFAYTDASLLTAAKPSSVCSPPISTRLGASRSRMAVPSARNSGLERIC